MAFLKFNFSLNGGTIQHPIDFPDLEAFSRNTYSQELIDVKRVINFISNTSNWPIDTNKINIIGHSRGGGIAILFSKYPSVNKICTWAAVASFEERFPKGEELLKWEKDGVRYIENARTKQLMPHSYDFYQDFLRNKQDLSIEKAIKNFIGKSLFIHGTLDQAVSVDNAYRLFRWAQDSEVFTLRSNHTFGSKHPWDSTLISEKLLEVVSKTITFFEKE